MRKSWMEANDPKKSSSFWTMNEDSNPALNHPFGFIVRHQSWCIVKGLSNNISIIAERRYRYIIGILGHVSHREIPCDPHSYLKDGTLDQIEMTVDVSNVFCVFVVGLRGDWPLGVLSLPLAGVVLLGMSIMSAVPSSSCLPEGHNQNKHTSEEHSGERLTPGSTEWTPASVEWDGEWDGLKKGGVHTWLRRTPGKRHTK